MKKSLSAGVLGVALATSTLVAGGASAAPAPADTPTCVSKAEFRQVSKGMTKTRVHRIFDISGKRTSISNVGDARIEGRGYKGCPRGSGVGIAFRSNDGGPWRLAAKRATWQ